MTTSTNTLRFCAFVFAAIAAVSVTFVRSLRAVADVAPPASQAPAELFNEKCSACHNTPNPNVEAMTAQEWQNTVNRMLYRHGASDSISPDQAKTIVAYLDTFAVSTAFTNQQSGPHFGHRSLSSIDDVWTADPTYTHVYVFRSAAIATPFQPLAAQWSIGDSGGTPSLLLTALKPGRPALLIAPTAPSGSMQIEAEFRRPPINAKSTSDASPPLSFGVTFDTVDASNYDLASYDDAKRQLTLSEVRDGVAGPIQIVPYAHGLPADAGGWHKLRVNVIGSHAAVWLDYDKKIDTELPDTPTTTASGLWTGTGAAAKDFIVDIYPPDSAESSDPPATN